MIFPKEIGPRKSACSYRKLHEKPDILSPYLILSFFHVPDMMAHMPLYGVRLYARERGMTGWLLQDGTMGQQFTKDFLGLRAPSRI